MDLKEQFYGTEIEMTGITRMNAAEAVAQMFGTDIEYRESYDSWAVPDQQGKIWKFMRDVSIDPQRLGRTGGSFRHWISSVQKW